MNSRTPAPDPDSDPDPDQVFQSRWTRIRLHLRCIARGSRLRWHLWHIWRNLLGR